MGTKRYQIPLVAVIGLIVQAGAHGAGIFSSVSYSQGVLMDTPAPHNGEVSQTLSGTTLPLNQSLTVGSSGGEESQATYNFYDNGSVAQFNISSSAALDNLNETASEGTGAYDNFVLSEPVAYTAVISNSTSSGIGGLVQFDIYKQTPQAGYVCNSNYITNSSWQSSGTLIAGVEYNFEEISGISNGSGVQSPTGMSSNTVTFTMTPIPEPASLAILSAFPFLLLKRRRWL